MSKGLVLISGVNGYIAAVAASHFLSHGYSVRGTVRRLSSGSALTSGPLKSYHESGAFTIVEVPDITAQGAFDEAAKDVTAILHLASPVSFSFKDPAPVLHAATQGTRSILDSALRAAGPQLRSVVLMSSIAAVRNATPPPYVFSERDWNDYAEKEVVRLGTQTPGPIIYAASKTAGERAFWAWKDEAKPSWGMSTVNPVFVIGPPLLPPKSATTVGETIQPIWSIFSGTPYFPIDPSATASTVDVRDVAKLLQSLVEHPDAVDGERYIASSAVRHPQAVADILRREFPGARARIQEGRPGEGYSSDYQVLDKEKTAEVDSGKARKLLEGCEWVGFEKSVIDTARALEGLI